MSNFKPLDEANPTLADIARGLNQVHSCVDGFRRNQERVNGQAARARKEQAAKLVMVEEAVGAVKTKQDEDGGRITLLSQMFGAEKMEPGEKRPKGHGIATWSGWKTVATLGGCVGLFVFGFQLVAAIAPAAYAYIMSLKP